MANSVFASLSNNDDDGDGVSSPAVQTASPQDNADEKLAIALEKERLIDQLANQTGNPALFLQDQKRVFERLSIDELCQEIASNHYQGILSKETAHGQNYIHIGPADIRLRNNIDFSSRACHLINLKFQGSEEIEKLNLSRNILRIAPDFSRLTGLKTLNMMQSGLRSPPPICHKTPI